MQNEGTSRKAGDEGTPKKTPKKEQKKHEEREWRGEVHSGVGKTTTGVANDAVRKNAKEKKARFYSYGQRARDETNVQTERRRTRKAS